ncbi:MAG: phospholipid carrier-dependent glycosyltransferase [Chloroflexi bacterium]|uniref:phospholipid carrier-dependent glycosyltransferase n=1 Tax=Candidatus Flexifilum breve TaxID=3140694 RepID=UPI0031351A09|nr:phospholipid carrier-dependent glycosyltransferase [Chloroflexota bacterium]
MLYVIAGAALTPFHGDESTQVYMSRDYAYQFLQRDLNLVMFHDPPLSAQEQDLRLLNGTLNKYLIGLAWHLGGFTLADINEQWDWGGAWDYNQSSNHAPTPALLNVARLPSAIFLALGVPVMFALGWLTGGAWAAVTASLLYALHPALLINGRRAMMEGSLTFFSLLTVLAGAWWLRRRNWIAALALGLAAGLTVASKHTGAFTVAAVFGVVGVVARCDPSPDPSPYGGREPADSLRLHPSSHSGRGGERSERGWGLALFPACSLLAAFVAALTFYALNPAWWSDPLSRAGDVLRLRQDLLAGQTATFGGYADFGAALVGFWNQVFVTPPQYFEVAGWDVYIADQIAAYEGSIWRGLHIGAVILVPLVLIGVVYLLRKTERSLRVLVGGWALVMLASVLLLTPIEWQRYYLPAYPPVLLLAAFGVAGIVDWVRNRTRPIVGSSVQ